MTHFTECLNLPCLASSVRDKDTTNWYKKDWNRGILKDKLGKYKLKNITKSKLLLTKIECQDKKKRYNFLHLQKTYIPQSNSNTVIYQYLVGA